jgi:hypothetical protein
MIEGSGSGGVRLTDPDLGGPKTYESGSAQVYAILLCHYRKTYGEKY